MFIQADTGFNAKEGGPANLKVSQRKTWQVRMVIETVLSMSTLVCHCQACNASRLELFRDAPRIQGFDVQLRKLTTEALITLFNA